MVGRLTLVSMCLFIVCATTLQSQTFRFEMYDTDGIPVHRYAERRARLIEQLSSNSLVVVQSAEVRNRQNDVNYEYRQSSDMLYLTGYPYPGATLLLSRGGIQVGDKVFNEVLFVKERIPEREQWSGVEMGIDEALKYLKIDTVLSAEDLTLTLELMFSDERSGGPDVQRPDTLFMPGIPTKYATMPLLGISLNIESELRKRLQAKYPGLAFNTSWKQIGNMRMIKDADELRLLQKAVDVTLAGHSATMEQATPNMKEYELEAIMEYHFKKMGAEDVGYPSIVGSNYNACILHYNTNRRTAMKSDLVLADCGAEFRGYTADVTRTFPISGKFTPEQLVIYNLVLEAQDSGIAVCRAGQPFAAADIAARSVITRGLFELGILKDKEATRKYFMHGTSHYLGLDVHDPGTYGPLEENMVITVEPGIYIAEGSDCDEKWWNIGVRIEDDILITAGDPVNMSTALPRSAHAIEALMQRP